MSRWSELRNRVGELIGGTRTRFRLRTSTSITHFNSVDASTPDYSYWDRLRRAMVKGLELSGLLIKPVGSKVAAWVMGQTVDWRVENDYTQGQVQDWWQRHHADILRGYEEAIHLGDCYLVINADLTVTVVPPNVVTPLYNDRDLSEIIGWKIVEKFPDPENPGVYHTITDEYLLKKRVRTVMQDSSQISRTVYKNLLGRLPVIHVANLFGADEVFGRPECGALVPILQRYGDILDTALRGNVRQGRPTPVIEKMGTAEQVRKFMERFSRSERQTLPDGTVETTEVIDFDPEQLFILGGEATFKYAAPGAFAADAEALLGVLYYLILEHTEIPEFVWGNAIGASKASADSQVEPFMKWLEKKRGVAQKWMVEIAQIALGYMALTDKKIKMTETAFFQWRPITTTNGQVALNAIVWAYGAGLLDEETALSLMPLRIVDPRGVLLKARLEFADRLAQPGAQEPPAKQGHAQDKDPNASQAGEQAA